MKECSKPLLHDMMTSLYYLYSVGSINIPYIESILNEEYNVYKIRITDDKFIAFQSDGDSSSIPIFYGIGDVKINLKSDDGITDQCIEVKLKHEDEN